MRLVLLMPLKSKIKQLKGNNLMANPYGKLKAVNADNSRSRCKVVAYAADPSAARSPRQTGLPLLTILLSGLC